MFSGGVFLYDTFYPKYVAYKEEQKVAEEKAKKEEEERQRKLAEEQIAIQKKYMEELESPLIKWDFSNTINEENGNISVPYGDIYTDTYTDSYGNSIVGTYFDGDGDYIDCGRGMNLTGHDTFNFLINCHDINKNYSGIFAKYETNYEGPYAFSIVYGKVNCWITTEDYEYNEIMGNMELESDVWYYISVVIDGNTLSIYINGELDRQQEIGTPITNEDLVTIGRQALLFYPESDLQFTGAIAEITYYDRVLSQDDIRILSDKRVKGRIGD